MRNYLVTYVSTSGELCSNIANTSQLARLIEFAQHLKYTDIKVYEIQTNNVFNRLFDFDSKLRILKVANVFGSQTDYHRITEGVRP